MSDPSQTVNKASLLDERALSKLKWRCRRGLLENDLFIARFFEKYESQITVRQAQGLGDLMTLADNDLLDLLLRRKRADCLSPSDASSAEALEVLAQMQVPTPAHPPAPTLSN